MDTHTRKVAARSRLEQQRSIAVAARDAGPPCWSCRYHDILATGGPFCTHLAVVDQSFDPVRGKLEAKVKTKPADARSSSGLCGPEGILFEPVLASAKVRAALGAAVLAGAALLTLFG